MEMLFQFGAPVVIITLIIVGVCVGKKSVKKKRSCCPSCKTYYYFDDDVAVSLGELKWEKKTNTVQQENIEYNVSSRIYYRIVTFTCTCPKCGKKQTLRQRFDVYSSAANHSQSQEEEMRLLKDKFKKYFDPCIFDKTKQNAKNK